MEKINRRLKNNLWKEQDKIQELKNQQDKIQELNSHLISPMSA